MRKEIFTIIYFLLGIVFITSEYLGYEIIRLISKPLLMPVLLFGYIFLVKTYKLKRNWLYVLAIVFCWLGDTFLLLQDYSINFFLTGLVSFLTGHVFYIFLFYKPLIFKPVSMLKVSLFAIIVLYAFLFIRYIFPYLDDLKIPVIIYAVIIFLMLLTALNQQGRIDKEAFQYIFGGAFLFVISDSLIAINKFHTSFSLSTLSIMTFYVFAQYFIMKGIIIRDQNVLNN